MGWSQMHPADAPWGDYGNILVSGFTERRDASGRRPLYRTGPFVPPITIAGSSDLLVTDSFRGVLEASSLRGLGFVEVVKKRIVKLEWRSWDLNAEEPAKYPAGGEPENYILGRKHDPQTAEEMGTIWEVLIEHTSDDPQGADIVRRTPSPFSYLLVTDEARTWLEANGDGWLRFDRADPTP